MVTTIAISDKQWKILNSMKEKGETFIEVLDKILKENKKRK